MNTTINPCLLPAGTLLLSMLLAGCDPDVLSPDPGTDPPPAGEVLGLVEVTITALGTGETTTHARTAADAAGLGVTRVTGVGGAHLSLGAPENVDASGDGTIQLSPLASGSFTDGVRGAGGVRYVYATYAVRNAQSDGTPYDTPRHNLTFLAVDTDGTIDETAVSQLARFDGTAADPAIAQAMVPTGSATQNPAGAVAPSGADVLQVLTEAEVATVLAAAPAGVHTVFPYGYVVRHASLPGTRVLAEDPAVGQFDGIVTFAFKVPLQATPPDDPFGISVVFLAMDDTDTRVTESLEEQGTGSVGAGAAALGSATGITLLGGSTTSVSGHGLRRICRVRTAGSDPNTPVATLVDATGCTDGLVSLPGNVIVVDRSAATGGDGRSWATAIKYLQDALACVRADSTWTGPPCTGIDEIWVAGGPHYPDEGAGQVDDSPFSAFYPVAGVSLYGGFAGGEYTRAQRDWNAQITILEGDVDQDSTNGDVGQVRSVIFFGALSPEPVTRATVVDGFTIRHAIEHAVLCGVGSAGGECSPVLRNLVLADNDQVFPNGGAAMILFTTAANAIVTPRLENVTFRNNRADGDGGALLIRQSNGVVDPELIGTVFDGNTATGHGGALAVRLASVRVVNSLFRGNSASGSNRGGAVSGRQGANLWMANVEFWDNTAGGGGAVDLTGADLTLIGATIAANTTNADSARAALHGGVGSFADLSNVIVWGNNPVAGQVHGLLPGLARHSLFEGGCPMTFTSCSNTVAGDPQFLALATGDLRLNGSSVAVDAGNNALLPVDAFDLDGDGDTAELIPYDLAAQVRVLDWNADDASAVVDLGAYERR